MINKFAIELLAEVADECDEKLIIGLENNSELFIQASQELTDLINILVECAEDDEL